jgi:hypothetical protein
VLHRPVAGTGEAVEGGADGVAVGGVADGLEGCPLDNAGELPVQADKAMAAPAIIAISVRVAPDLTVASFEMVGAVAGLARDHQAGSTYSVPIRRGSPPAAGTIQSSEGRVWNTSHWPSGDQSTPAPSPPGCASLTVSPPSALTT